MMADDPDAKASTSALVVPGDVRTGQPYRKQPTFLQGRIVVAGAVLVAKIMAVALCTRTTV